MFSQKEEKVYTIQKYILSHLYEKVTLEELANLFQLSEWQCYRLFKEVAGMSIADYIRRAKLSEAARQLKEEHKKVLDVALDAGYDSPEGFQRAFFSEFGCNPA
nr:AraC family transcriptional regulator [Treponema sp.]